MRKLKSNPVRLLLWVLLVFNTSLLVTCVGLSYLAPLQLDQKEPTMWALLIIIFVGNVGLFTMIRIFAKR